jgi:hypothetical protein
MIYLWFFENQILYEKMLFYIFCWFFHKESLHARLYLLLDQSLYNIFNMIGCYWKYCIILGRLIFYTKVNKKCRTKFWIQTFVGINWTSIKVDYGHLYIQSYIFRCESENASLKLSNPVVQKLRLCKTADI